VVWVFWPSVSNGFVNLDDPLYACENVHVLSGLTWQGIGWAFTNLDAGLWHPLTWLSLMLDCQMFGLRAGGHHLVSLLLHATNTLLLFLCFQRMTGATWRSAAMAVLFALHPLHVESVAWISERKDVLSTFFWMLALLAYTVYVEQSKAGGKESTSSIRFHASRFTFHVSPCYLLSLFFFCCGLMSKTMVVTLPFILLLLDWWPLQRFQLKTQNSRLKILGPLLLEKLPFLAAAFLCSLLTLHAVKGVGALPGVAQFPVGDRISNAVLSFVRYLAQTVYPVDLAVYYPYPKTFPFGPVIGAALLGLTASALLLWAARQRPYLAVGWLWYVVTLLPVIGLVQVGGHSRADRYTYVPLIGLFLLVVWAAHDFTKRWRYQVVCLAAAAVLVFSVCLVLTRRQIGYWKDSETLLRHALAVTGDNSMAQNNLGVALIKQGQLDEAVARLQDAIRLAPNYAEAYNNLGTALAMQGRLDEAIARFQESLRLQPHHAQAHNDLGAALGRQGRLDEAIAHLQEAVRLAPDLADARCNLGDALAAKGRFDEAIAQYQQAIQLNPNYPDTHNHLGIALSSKGRLDEAIGHFRQALRLNPDYAEARGNLGAALGRMGRLDEAIYHLQEAVRLKPDYAGAQKNLRAALAAKAASQKQSGSPPAP
jgi:tetratricopeptide (TPR) repeat protein